MNETVSFLIIYGFVKGCLKTKVTSLFAIIFLMKAFGQKKKKAISKVGKRGIKAWLGAPCRLKINRRISFKGNM